MAEAEPQESREELVCRTAVVCAEGVGPTIFGELLEAYGSCANLVRSARKRGILSLPRVSAKTAEAILRIQDELPRWESALRELEGEGIRAISEMSGEYPDALKSLEHPPPILFVRGELRRSDEGGLAIVGATRPTRHAWQIAMESARRAAASGLSVVSGLARGIDSAAHLGAISAGGRTVAFPPTGLRKVPSTPEFRDPPAISQSGALVSTFPPDEEWKVGSAIYRNQLIAAMSGAVFVVESRKQGGALYTAQVAKDLGKRVFALSKRHPGREDEGNQELLSRGAEAITCFADVEGMIAGIAGKRPRDSTLS